MSRVLRTCLRHAPTLLAACGLDMCVSHPAMRRVGFFFPSEVLTPRRSRVDCAGED
jgi:hypothetical protein